MCIEQAVVTIINRSTVSFDRQSNISGTLERSLNYKNKEVISLAEEKSTHIPCEKKGPEFTDLACSIGIESWKQHAKGWSIPGKCL